MAELASVGLGLEDLGHCVASKEVVVVELKGDGGSARVVKRAKNLDVLELDDEGLVHVVEVRSKAFAVGEL